MAASLTATPTPEPRATVPRYRLSEKLGRLPTAARASTLTWVTERRARSSCWAWGRGGGSHDQWVLEGRVLQPGAQEGPWET